MLYLAAKQIEVLTHIARCRIQDRPLKSFMPHTCCSPYAHRFTRFLKVKRKFIIYDDVVKGIFPFGLGASCFHGWWLRLHLSRHSSREALTYPPLVGALIHLSCSFLNLGLIWFPIWSHVFIVDGFDHTQKQATSRPFPPLKSLFFSGLIILLQAPSTPSPGRKLAKVFS